MPDRNRELRVRLAAALTHKFAPIHIQALIERFGSLGDVLGAPPVQVAAVKGITSSKLKLLRETLAGDAIDTERRACDASGTRLILSGDADYPPLLGRIADPPALLWVRGALDELDHLALAIVGSRNADYYGTAQAARFAGDLARRRITVVSGLARGVDTAAHRGALEAGGRTIAVVGSGFEQLYPPENQRLAAEIAAHGALLSEFPLHTPAHARNFPRRNRIISGLSLGVLVAQASMRSGSLITARLAGEQGREVFAIPGKIDGGEHAGCHALIKDGAKLVESADDILVELRGIVELPEHARPAPKRRAFEGTATETAIVGLLAPSDPVNIEEIIQRSGLPAPQVGAALLTLEMRGAIRQLPGRNFVLG